jgi:hypothetical protein
MPIVTLFDSGEHVFRQSLLARPVFTGSCRQRDYALPPTGGPCPPRANRGVREAHGKSPEEDITKGLFPDKVNRIDSYLYRLSGLLLITDRTRNC